MRKRLDGADVYRAALPGGADSQSLARFCAVLHAPDAFSQWFPNVEKAEAIESLGPQTQITKARFRLGWPASPRDAVLLTHVLADAEAVVYVATSVPRAREMPSYLRPTPPYVRSHVHLFAVCAQRRDTTLQLTAYWSWDPRGSWVGSRGSGPSVQLPLMLRALDAYAREHADQLPYVRSYGVGLEPGPTTLDVSRDVLRVHYTVLQHDVEQPSEGSAPAETPLALFSAPRDASARSLDVCLPREHGWDVHVRIKAPRASATGSPGAGSAAGGAPMWSPSLLAGDAERVLRVQHEPVTDPDSIVRVSISVQRVEASSEVRVNGTPITAAPGTLAPARRPREPLPMPGRGAALRIATPARGSDPLDDSLSEEAPRSASPAPAADARLPVEALVRRSYVYFTSLLQEPDTKWRRVADAANVTVAQLESVDPTLVVYRAEATYVGVSVWDVFSTLSDPALAAQWDRSVAGAELLGSAGSQSMLWHVRQHGTWAMSARDAVLVQTSYKSPSSIHLFSFSTDDTSSFPAIPAPRAGTIRTQVDLRGWSIEALSPTTLHVTLVEQSDPRGWTSKSTVPAQMITAVSGAGEYAIRHGGAPVLTRLQGAEARVSHVDHDKATYQLEYAAREPPADDGSVECEVRCDMEAWSPNVDVVVNPPPASASCLRRHKLSLGGGGLWLTVEHAAAALGGEPVRIVVRKGPAQSRERGVVLLNGSRMRVDMDELDTEQLQELVRRKRNKPQRVPLDFAAAGGGGAFGGESDTPDADAEHPFSPLPPDSPTAHPPRPPPPMHHVLDALLLLRGIAAERHPDPAGVPAGWAFVSEQNGLYIRKKLLESVSPTISLLRADKVVQGLAAEELLAAVAHAGCRQMWDERMRSWAQLESYGNGASSWLCTSQSSLFFWPRAFLLGALTAHATPQAAEAEGGAGGGSSAPRPRVYFHVAASYQPASAAARFDMARVNPENLPLGRVLIDGWILENVDPYSSASYPIPSTRCTHVSAIDYGSAVPAALNTVWNAALPRGVLQLEAFLRTKGPPPTVLAPPHWLRVLGDGRDEDGPQVWSLQSPRRACLLLADDFDAQRRRMCARVLYRGGPEAPALVAPPDSPEAGLPRLPSRGSLKAHSRETSRVNVRDAARGAAPPAPAHHLLDMQVQLRQYPDGYAIHLAWDRAVRVASGAAAGDAAATGTFDMNQQPERAPDAALPLEVRVYDLPPTSLFAATRTGAARSHMHLVRVSLPLEAAAAAAVPAHLPALVQLSLAPLEPLAGDADPRAAGTDAGSGTGQVPVTINGKVAEIVYGDEAARAVPRLDAYDARVEELDRVPPGGASAGLPASPSAEAPAMPGWAHTLERDVLAVPVACAGGARGEHPAAPPARAPAEHPQARGVRPPPPHAPAEKHGAAPPPPPPQPPQPFFGLLQRRRSDYGAMLNSTFASVGQLVSRTGARRESEAPAAPRRRASDGSGASEDAADAALPGTLPPGAAAPRARFRLSTLVLVAIVAFLAGSLVRSMMVPADFLLLPRAAAPVGAAAQPADEAPRRGMFDAAAREIDNFMRAARQLHSFALHGATSTEAAETQQDSDKLEAAPAQDMVRWREIRRLVDLRAPGGWDVVLALVRR